MKKKVGEENAVDPGSTRGFVGEKFRSKLPTKERASREGGRDAAQVRSWVTSRPSVEFRVGTTVGENVGDMIRIASGQL